MVTIIEMNVEEEVTNNHGRLKRFVPESDDQDKVCKGWTKKTGILFDMAVTHLKSIRKRKSWCFTKIQLVCCRIGVKPFKKMAKKS